MSKFLSICSVFILLGVASVSLDVFTPPSPLPPSKVETLDRSSKATKRKSQYGHFNYSEASRSDLVDVGNNQKLHRDAAMAFKRMKAAAKKEGVILRVQSGFRSKETQNYLFYGLATQRKQSLKQRAKVVAPPGYSEHHTGYALDVSGADGVILHESFARTSTFKWLSLHAKSFGFEISFPPNNAQGVNYEPWHWRYVGSVHSKSVFHPNKE